MSTPYTPIDETPSQLWVDRATIIGFDIAYAAYGVNATLFFLCLNLLWRERKNKPRQTYAWITYICFVFIFGSMANGIDMRLSQVIFVDNRNYPGGPGAYHAESFNTTINIVCTIACVIGTWLQDGLLLFRFYVIVSTAWWMMVVPVAVFIVSIVVSCLLMSSLVTPGSEYWQKSSMNVALVYWSTSVATNILLTTLIVASLVHVRLQVRKVLGNRSQLPYLTISAMFIESAALYTAFALAFLIPYSRNNTVNTLFFSILGQVQCIAPLLIVFRVAQGRAITRKFASETMSTVDWATTNATNAHTHSISIPTQPDMNPGTSHDTLPEKGDVPDTFILNGFGSSEEMSAPIDEKDQGLGGHVGRGVFEAV